MAWGSEVPSTQITADSTQQFLLWDGSTTTGNLLLNPGETAHVEIVTATSSTGTALLAAASGSLDATDHDTVPFLQGRTEHPTTAAVRHSFLVSGRYSFRVGVVGTSSGPTFTVNASYRKDGVSL